MSREEPYRSLVRYNAWMNRKVVDACDTLPDAERKRERGAFFGSIHRTLNHILLVDLLWLDRFGGRPMRFKDLGQEIHADWDALKRERAEADAGLVGRAIVATSALLGAGFGMMLFSTFQRPVYSALPSIVTVVVADSLITPAMILATQPLEPGKGKPATSKGEIAIERRVAAVRFPLSANSRSTIGSLLFATLAATSETKEH